MDPPGNAPLRRDLALLSRANALLASDDERALFDTAVERLRDEHRRKRSLMAELYTRGW